MSHINDHRSTTGLIERYVGTAYDRIALVADHLPALLSIAEWIAQGGVISPLKLSPNTGTTPPATDELPINVNNELWHGTQWIAISQFHAYQPPNPPTANATADSNGFVTVVGTAVIGGTIHAIFNAGPEGTALVDGSGNYTITSAVAQTLEVPVDVWVETDLEGPSGHVAAAYTLCTDATAPGIGVFLSVSRTPQDYYVAGEYNKIHGTIAGEPMALAKVTVPNGDIIDVTLDASGNGTFVTVYQQPEGQLSMTVQDPAGNQSSPVYYMPKEVTVLSAVETFDGKITVTGVGVANSVAKVSLQVDNNGITETHVSSVLINNSGAWTLTTTNTFSVIGGNMLLAYDASEDGEIDQVPFTPYVAVTTPSVLMSGLFSQATSAGYMEVVARVINTDGATVVTATNSDGTDSAVMQPYPGMDNTYIWMHACLALPTNGNLEANITTAQAVNTGLGELVAPGHTNFDLFPTTTPFTPTLTWSKDAVTGAITLSGNGSYPYERLTVSHPVASGNVVAYSSVTAPFTWTVVSPPNQENGFNVNDMIVRYHNHNFAPSNQVVDFTPQMPVITTQDVMDLGLGNFIRFTGTGEEGNTITLNTNGANVVVGSSGIWTLDTDTGIANGDVFILTPSVNGATGSTASFTYSGDTTTHIRLTMAAGTYGYTASIYNMAQAGGNIEVVDDTGGVTNVAIPANQPANTTTNVEFMNRTYTAGEQVLIRITNINNVSLTNAFVKSIDIFEGSELTSIKDMLADCPELTSASCVSGSLDNVTDASYAFRNSGTSVGAGTAIVGFGDMPEVLTTYGMFYNAKVGTLGDFVIPKATTLTQMFKLSSILGGTAPEITAVLATNASGLYASSNINTVPVYTLHPTSGLDCSSLLEDTLIQNIPATLQTATVVNASNMFGGMTQLLTSLVADFPIATTIENLYTSCPLLTSVPQMSCPKVTNASNAFSHCVLLDSFPGIPDLASTSPTLIYDATSMFIECEALTALPDINLDLAGNLQSFLKDTLMGIPVTVDVPKCTNLSHAFANSTFTSVIVAFSATMLTLESMCSQHSSGGTSQNGITAITFVGCDFSNIQTTDSMFRDCILLENQSEEMAMPANTSTLRMYQGCTVLTCTGPMTVLSTASTNYTWNDCPALVSPTSGQQFGFSYNKIFAPVVQCPAVTGWGLKMTVADTSVDIVLMDSTANAATMTATITGLSGGATQTITGAGIAHTINNVLNGVEFQIVSESESFLIPNGANQLITDVDLFQNPQLIINMNDAFRDVTTLVTASFDNMTNLEYAARTFFLCTGLTSLSMLGSFTNLANGRQMCSGCTSLTTFPEDHDFPVVGNVVAMFKDTQVIPNNNQVLIPEASHASHFFSGNTAITQIDLVDISDNNAGGSYASYNNFFFGCTNLVGVEVFDGPHAAIVDSLFEGCSSLTHVASISDIPNSVNADNMFKDCVVLNCIGGLTIDTGSTIATMWDNTPSLVAPNSAEQTSFATTKSYTNSGTCDGVVPLPAMITYTVEMHDEGVDSEIMRFTPNAAASTGGFTRATYNGITLVLNGSDQYEVDMATEGYHTLVVEYTMTTALTGMVGNMAYASSRIKSMLLHVDTINYFHPINLGNFGYYTKSAESFILTTSGPTVPVSQLSSFCGVSGVRFVDLSKAVIMTSTAMINTFKTANDLEHVKINLPAHTNAAQVVGAFTEVASLTEPTNDQIDAWRSTAASVGFNITTNATLAPATETCQFEVTSDGTTTTNIYLENCYAPITVTNGSGVITTTTPLSSDGHETVTLPATADTYTVSSVAHIATEAYKVQFQAGAPAITGIEILDMPKRTSLYQMCLNCTNLTEATCNNPNVIPMGLRETFKGCTSLTTLSVHANFFRRARDAKEFLMNANAMNYTADVVMSDMSQATRMFAYTACTCHVTAHQTAVTMLAMFYGGTMTTHKGIHLPNARSITFTSGFRLCADLVCVKEVKFPYRQLGNGNNTFADITALINPDSTNQIAIENENIAVNYDKGSPC